MGMNILCMIVGFCFGVLLHLILKTPKGPYYLYKGKIYAFIEKGKMKTPSGEWIDCVFYRSTKDNTLYSREVSQFYRIFRKAGE